MDEKKKERKERTYIHHTHPFTHPHPPPNSSVLGPAVDVPVFPISAKLALEAKLAAKPHHPSVGPAADAWQRSRFGPLQEYLDKILTDEEKVGAWVGVCVCGGGDDYTYTYIH